MKLIMEFQQTKNVYLDSNDFSDLSATPDKLSDTDTKILVALREAKRSGRAEFFISPVHISEAVHASELYRDASVRRAELMQELGAGNFLKFPVEICTDELKKALAGTHPVKSTLAEILSQPDEWFGISDALKGLAGLRDETNKTVREELRKATPNRHEYRKKLAELDPNKKRSHPRWIEIFEEGFSKSQPTNIPLGLLNPDLVFGWYLGKVTDSEFRANTIRVLNDIPTLFKYLLDELGHRATLYDLVRDQGRKWSKFIETGTTQLMPLFVAAQNLNYPVDPKQIAAKATEGDFWPKVISTLSETTLESRSIEDIKTLVASSPSTSIFIDTLITSLEVRLQSTYDRVSAGTLTPSIAKISDYGDFLHAIYAPYFDVFRCDGKTASVIPSENISGKIISKRAELLNSL